MSLRGLLVFDLYIHYRGLMVTKNATRMLLVCNGLGGFGLDTRFLG
jgi:hypothetical protein